MILPFAVYTHAGQEFAFFISDFAIHNLYSCGLGVRRFVIFLFIVYTLVGQKFDFVCFLTLPFAVYYLAGQELDLFYFDEQFRLVFGSMFK